MKKTICAITTALAVVASFTLATTADAADHLDAPAIEIDGRTDINDLYAFQSPSDSAQTVFITTVNPLAGILSPTTFNTRSFTIYASIATVTTLQTSLTAFALER